MFDTWHIKRGNRITGPYSTRDIVNYISIGEIDAMDVLWREGQTHWIPAIIVFQGCFDLQQSLNPPVAPNSPTPPKSEFPQLKAIPASNRLKPLGFVNENKIELDSSLIRDIKLIQAKINAENEARTEVYVPIKRGKTSAWFSFVTLVAMGSAALFLLNQASERPKFVEKVIEFANIQLAAFVPSSPSPAIVVDEQTSKPSETPPANQLRTDKKSKQKKEATSICTNPLPCSSQNEPVCSDTWLRTFCETENITQPDPDTSEADTAEPNIHLPLSKPPPAIETSKKYNDKQLRRWRKQYLKNLAERTSTN